MISRRIFIPAVLILTMLAQFMPAAIFGPQPAAAVTRCDWAQFVADVTVPDGATYAPGTAFTKTWRLKNIGTCTWTTSYALVFVSGSQMGAPSMVNLPSSVAPGGTVDVSVNMTAPAVNGHYRGYWQLRNASGVLFGIGTYANKSFWVDINVSTSYVTGYDFVANYCSATWTSGAGILPCPGTDGNANGFVLKLDSPRLENGVTDASPGLLTFPQNVTNGYIQGIYPAFTVQSGDRFQSIVNCQYGATSCYVTFRLDYQIGSGPVKTFWTFKEKYEGLYYRANLDLSSLAGQNVKFILTILASGSPTGDRALWGAPRIVRGGSVPPISTPTEPIPPACDRAKFITDISVPDGTTFTGGTPFTKTWRLQNVGTCTWTTSYALVFFSGDAMSAIPVIYLPASVAPGQMINLSAAMTAPNASGHYRGYWKLRNASGVKFGIGATGTNPFWVDINVAAPGLNVSTTTITADNPDPSTPGQAVTVSVTVSGAGAIPTGTVAISGADANCTITLSGGSGSCNVVFNTFGNKTLTATYSGDGNFAGSLG
ncbi:MAG: NBR1-Ig-like domain-containing protein, partial [Anaerolineales bacterium]|nr:NBR1-Ig-like domain-containing protein [Anaerolineales bacterium]